MSSHTELLGAQGSETALEGSYVFSQASKQASPPGSTKRSALPWGFFFLGEPF